MTLELIVFIASILFGILLYWRESNGNDLYRFVNKLVNSKELQMKPEDKTGFVYQQKLLLRLVFIAFLFLGFIVIAQFLIPIGYNYNTISTFASSILGTIIGTYLAGFIIKTSKTIEEKSESLEDIMQDTIEKGKDFVDDIKTKKPKVIEEAKKEIKSTPKPEEKSARERLKDKGLL
tara:strand:+ start:19246 stop:19776 length:531 start_codon:yes stop_codon:yes gene_type:complete